MIMINKVHFRNCIDGIKDMIKGGGPYVDSIITDPPYLTQYKTGHRKGEHKFKNIIQNDDNQELVKEYFELCYKVLKDNKSLFSFCDIDTLPQFREFIEGVGFEIRSIIIWSKGGGGMGDLQASFSPDYEVIIHANKGRHLLNGTRPGSVWFYPRIPGSKLVHQNQKPLELMHKILDFGTNHGDLVLDGFMGSFTTAIACKNRGRNFIGFEIDEHYYKVGMERLTGEKQYSIKNDLGGFKF